MPGALYGFAYRERVLAFLESLQNKQRRQIMTKIEALASNPCPPKSKVLRGMGNPGEPVHRIRSGDYRILYTVRNNPDHIVILDIGHRKDVYR